MKAEEISNATTSGRTAANIIQQLDLAITHGYDCVRTGRHVRFNFIFVVTSQGISNTARDNLNKKADLVSFSGLRYQVGSDIIKLIDKYLPKFYYYQSGIHAQLAQSLQEKCEKLNDLKNIPLQTNIDVKALLDVYVKPRLRQIKSRKIKGSMNNEAIVTKTPEEIIGKNSRILIVGEAGSGKSLTLREFVLNRLSENTRDEKPNVPLLVKAYQLAENMQSDFEDTLTDTVKDGYSVKDFDLGLISDTKLTLLIDGIDEIVDSDKREKLLRSIFKYGDDNQDVSIVITSRMTKEITKVGNFHGFERWDIMAFNSTQVRAFIEKWFSERNDVGHKLLETLQNHDLLEKLPNTPLVLTLLAILFDSKDYREIPSNLAELYKMFVNLLLGRWNLDRRVETLYDANIKEHLAEEIAIYLHTNQQVSISIEQFKEVISQTEIQLGFPLDSDEIIKDFIDQTSLLIENDKGDLEFRHLSFQEFLVGNRIYSKGEKKELSLQFLIEHSSDQWWVKVLYFYCGLRQNNPTILESVLEHLSEIEGPEQLFGILELGYLIQTSYLTPIDTRMQVIEMAIRLYYHSLDAIHEVKVNDKYVPIGLMFTAFTMWLIQHYSSGMLVDHYRDLYLKLLSNEYELSEETGFALMVLALFIASRDEHDLLSDVYSYVKPNPKQLMALDIIGESIIEELDAQQSKSKQIKEFKSSLKQIKKWFKEHPDITKALTTSTPMLEEN